MYLYRSLLRLIHCLTNLGPSKCKWGRNEWCANIANATRCKVNECDHMSHLSPVSIISGLWLWQKLSYCKKFKWFNNATSATSSSKSTTTCSSSVPTQPSKSRPSTITHHHHHHHHHTYSCKNPKYYCFSVATATRCNMTVSIRQHQPHKFD